MLDAGLTWLETLPAAEAFAASRHAYPLVNALHIIGLGSLFGAILALDLRLLGLFRAIPARPLAIALPRVAGAGLALAMATGLLLFSVDPHEYAANRAFVIKVSLVATGAIHALWVHRSRAWAALRKRGTIEPALKISAGVSLAIWTGAILAGRWIAF